MRVVILKHSSHPSRLKPSRGGRMGGEEPMGGGWRKSKHWAKLEK